MAKKRMFSLSVIDTDAFLDLPLSAQALYFHLAMRADDDGFIDRPKRIVSEVGANMDDIRILIAKRFLLVFDSGVIVIKHWRMHNTIQNDRYTPTKYQEELEMLYVKKNKAYSLDRGESEEKALDDSNVSKLYPNRIQTVSTDIDKDIDKDKGLDIEKETKRHSVPVDYFPELPELDQTFRDYIKMRKTIKAPMSDKAITLAMSKLKKLATDPMTDAFDEQMAIDILNQSIMNSWKGLYQVKEEPKRGGGIDWSKV